MKDPSLLSTIRAAQFLDRLLDEEGKATVDLSEAIWQLGRYFDHIAEESAEAMLAIATQPHVN